MIVIFFYISRNYIPQIIENVKNSFMEGILLCAHGKYCDILLRKEKMQGYLQ